jgi:hypothetical protein
MFFLQAIYGIFIASYDTISNNHRWNNYMRMKFKDILKQWPYFGLLLFTAMFTLLISIRLGLFDKHTIEIKAVVQSLQMQETWMNIFHQEQKIGYSHRMIQPDNDMYILSEKTYLQLNTMGTIHDLHIQTKAILAKDLSLDQFSFQLNSDPFKFKVQGTVELDNLRLIIDNSETTIPLSDKIYLPAALMDAAYALDLKHGESQNLKLFDPSTMGMRTVTLFYDGQEQLEIMGSQLLCNVYSMDFIGIKSTAWIDSTGQIVQEKGIMGMTLKKTDRQHAYKNLKNIAHKDLIEWVSVPSNVVLEHQERHSEITYHIEGEFDKKPLEGGRQIRSGLAYLTIKKERIPPPPYKVSMMAKYCQPTIMIPSDNPGIIAQLQKITRNGDSHLVKIKKIMVWLNENIKKRPVLSVPNAIETLKHKRGDCNEHAVLTASLLRAAGIPTQIAAGLVYQKGRFYYHAWNEVYLNKWITLDVIMNQFPADVTHIRLVKGSPDAQMALLGMIGNINLKIVEKNHD